ncbi:MAG: hypothetical protein ABEJ72_05315 [Candidatus Aenigmatarchaeota archaeon]
MDDNRPNVERERPEELPFHIRYTKASIRTIRETIAPNMKMEIPPIRNETTIERDMDSKE